MAENYSFWPCDKGAANGSVISTLRAGCHFYLAPTAPDHRGEYGLRYVEIVFVLQLSVEVIKVTNHAVIKRSKLISDIVPLSLGRVRF
jgi:hypothetical protein